MKVIIDGTEVADQLMKCKVGDQKAVTITVTSNDGETIEGDATDVEHVTGAEDYEDEEMPERGMHRGKSRVPKAILMVAEKAA